MVIMSEGDYTFNFCSMGSILHYEEIRKIILISDKIENSFVYIKS